MVSQVVTANRLLNGHVVYMGADGGWSDWIEQSQIAMTKEVGADLMQVAQVSAAEGVVVDPYLVDVVQENGAVRPLRYREVLRANGPSIHPHFGKQAERARE